MNIAEDFNDKEEISTDETVSTFFEIFKKISAMSIPMALSYTFSFEVFLTTVMLALLNPEDDQEIAAITLIATMMNTAIILGMSPLFGMSMVASKAIGELTEAEANNEDEISLEEKRSYISAYVKNGLVISSAVTPPIMASLYFSKFILAEVFGQDEITAELAQNFLRYYSFAVPGIMARMTFEQIMFSFGCANAAMIMGLSSFGIGSAIAGVLGFGKIGLEKYGTTGVAIGYVAEAYLTAILYGCYIAFHPKFKNYKFFNFVKKINKSFAQLKELLLIGAPISFSVANELAMSFSLGLFAGIVGTKEQAALTSALQCVYFSFIPLSAFGQACSQEVSKAVGGKHYSKASAIGKIGLLVSIVYIAPFPIVCAAFPKILTLAAGSTQDQTLDILTYLMPIISTGVIADSARYNVLQQLRALGDFKGSAIVSVGGLTVGIISAGFLGLKTELGIFGVASGYTIGILLAGAGLGVRWGHRIQSYNIRALNESKPTLKIDVDNLDAVLIDEENLDSSLNSSRSSTDSYGSFSPRLFGSPAKKVISKIENDESFTQEPEFKMVV
jgi:MATE family multidrug resistance protein